MNSSNQKPCLVQTSQGFSISYNNRFLYSKYNPSRAINTIIEQLHLLPGTVILCCSPVLNYGLKELSAKLPSECIMLGVELNNDLYNFEQENIINYSEVQNFHLLTIKESLNLPLILAEKSYKLSNNFELNSAGTYKRVVRLDFSAGTQFNSELYDNLLSACTNSIKTFWTNRLTLTTFGRRYTMDFFKNLKVLPETTDINSYINKITKPIVCFGAGQSINSGIDKIKTEKNNYFILCTDTSYSSLLENGIIPDGVFVEEAQFIINKAFIGLKKYDTHFFTGLSSTPQISQYIKKENISFFTTLFAETDFLKNLSKNDFLPVQNKPFGSVGLTMVYYALQFRKVNSIPVYLYGLDFSYSAGITHGKATMAHTERLCSSNRINVIQNYKASYNSTSIKFTDKNNNIFYTTPSLQNYALLFNGLFAETENLYDSSDSGITLNIVRKSPEKNNIQNQIIEKKQLTDDKKDKINAFLESEKNQLTELRDILSGKILISDEQRNLKIKELLQNKDYLYFHFPDGYKFEINQSFLNRIRTEIDFFLKFL